MLFNINCEIMKTKTAIFSFFFFFSSIIYCQESKTQILQGSWMGKVSKVMLSLYQTQAIINFH